MRSAEFVLALLIAVAALVTIARRLGIAYPIFLVIGGLLLGLVPGLPRPHVEPDLIFLLVLPPILYTTAFFTPLRSLRADLGNISSLAIGLIIATAGAVAVVAHALIGGITWPVALALGAIVAPSDSIAAAAIVARLAVPRRIVTLLEGESLLNDATALTIYRIAVAAAVGGALSWTGALTTFAIAGLGGWAIGLAVGWVIAQIRSRIEDTPVEITISLLTPYAAFLPAEQLGASGVIATVVAGLYLGRRGSRIMGADVRLTGRAVWETVTFLLYGFVFILTGLEMPPLLRSLTPSVAIQLVGIGVAVTGVLVAVRALWIFATAYVPPLLRGQPRTPHLLAHSVVLSWAGMRGVVSLAVALALPLSLPDGGPFPAREALLVVTLTVIVLTLLGQGLTLPWLIRSLRLGADVEVREEEGQRQAGARPGRHSADRSALRGLAGAPPAARSAAGHVSGPFRARRAAARSVDRRGGSRAHRAPRDQAHDHRLGARGAPAPSRRGRDRRRRDAKPRARARPRRAAHGRVTPAYPSGQGSSRR